MCENNFEWNNELFNEPITYSSGNIDIPKLNIDMETIKEEKGEESESGTKG